MLNQLSDIIDKETAEKVLMQTDQITIKLFLIQINRLLDYNQKVIADYAKMKESLKKNDVQHVTRFENAINGHFRLCGKIKDG